MAVPTSISDLSTTPGSNPPSGSDSPTVTDDHFRAVYSFIAQLRDGKSSNGVDIASASTTDIGAANSSSVRITGTTTITSFGTNYNGPRYVVFAGALTLTYNASTMILPGGEDIITAAGDGAIVIPNASTPNGWRVLVYQRAAADDGSRYAQTGDIKTTARSTAPTGWLKANGSTIGNASSGATARANADTEALFTVLWNDWTNADLPIQTSTGSASTRGASAAADFAANKRLPLPDIRGEFVRGLDDGRGIDTSRVLGSSQAQQTRAEYGRFNSSTNVQASQLSNTTRLSGAHSSFDDAGNMVGNTFGAETRPRNVALLYCIKL